MKPVARFSIFVVPFVLICGVEPAHGQFGSLGSPPTKPKRERNAQPVASLGADPKSVLQKNRRDALKAYSHGKQKLRQGQLLDALQAFEKAAQLDPQSAAVHKALIPMYSALARDEDALAACRNVLKINPGDAEVWYAAASIHRRMGESKKSRQALEKGLAALQAGKQLDLAQQMYFDLGRLQQDAGQDADAVQSYRRSAHVLQKIIKNAGLEPAKKRGATLRIAGLYERIGKILADGGRAKDAVAAYQKAQQADAAGATRLYLPIARQQLAMKNLPAAQASLDKYLRLRPQTMEAYRLKIQLLDAAKRSGSVIPWLETCVARDRFNERLQLLLAEQCRRRDRPRQAERIYLNLAKDNPDIDIYQQLFRMYARQPFGFRKILETIDGSVAKANKKEALRTSAPAKARARAMIGALQREQKLAENLLQTALPRRFRDGLQYQTVQLLAVLADKHRNPKQSEKYWRELVGRGRRGSEGLAYSGLLRSLWKQNRIEEVVKICNSGLRNARATNHVLFHSQLARAFLRLEKYDESVREADEAVRLASESNRIPMHRLKLHILVQCGRYQEAEKSGLALLQKFKKPADIRKIRAALSSVYSAMKNFKKAEEQLQLVLKIDPLNATAYNDLGYLWADRGIKLDAAEKLIRKAIALDRDQRRTFLSAEEETDKDRAAYVDSLGWVLFRRGKIQQARKELERATTLPGGDDPVIWEHLGDVCFRLPNRSQALKCWRKALSLYEESPIRPRDDRYRDLQQKIKQLEKAQP